MVSDEPTVRELREGVIPKTLAGLYPNPPMTAFERVLAEAEEYMHPDEIEAAVREHDRYVAGVALRSAAELLRTEARLDEQNLGRYTRHKAAAWLERLADG